MTHFTVNMMTAAFTPGDAIGNYIVTSARLWQTWGVKVNIYADHIAPVYGNLARQSKLYQPTGQAILWFHYSIYADNVEQLLNSYDFKVLDYHGITPPHLFAGQDPHLQTLCQKGIELLPNLNGMFNFCLVHSEYARQELLQNGFTADKIHKFPYCVDTSRLGTNLLPDLAIDLTQLEYYLFIGRIVPNKDILSLLEIFAHITAKRPNAVLFLIGTREHAPNYQKQLDHRIQQLGLGKRVMFTGKVSDATVATFLRHAKLLFITSDHEAFGVPLIEAMHFAVPSVVHHLPPLPEVAGEAGLIIDKHNPQEAATAVLQLLNDPIQYQQLSQACQSRAQTFTEKAMATALLTVLQQEFLGKPT